MSGLPQQARVPVPRPVRLQPEDLPGGSRRGAARCRAEEDVYVVAQAHHHCPVGAPGDAGEGAVWGGEKWTLNVCSMFLNRSCDKLVSFWCARERQ